MLNDRSGNQRTSYDEMQDALDDFADDMSMAVDESKWKEWLIYLIEAMGRKVKDREEFDTLMFGLLEYLSKRVE